MFNCIYNGVDFGRVDNLEITTLTKDQDGKIIIKPTLKGEIEFTEDSFKELAKHILAYYRK